MRSIFIFLAIFLTFTNLIAKTPVRLDVIKLSDNNLCDDSLDPTGSAFAVIIDDKGKEDTNLKDFTVNWYLGTSPSGTPIHTGPTYDQMADGTYTIVAIHDKSSFTDQVTITIDKTDAQPDAYVKEVKNAKNCKENDGRAKVRVQSFFPSEGDPDHFHDDIKDCKHDICWNFVWYEGNNPFIGDVVAVGADAKDLKPGTYAVVVTNEIDGCQSVVSLSVGLDAEEPIVDGTVVTNITDCEDTNAGALTAFVFGENSNKYEFDWYIGDFIKATPDYNNQTTITGLAAGNYTVVATEKSSGCPSDPLTLTVADLTSVPVIDLTLDAEQTSCDPANPNGAVSATADGTTTGYSFEWFEGQNTLDENLVGSTPSLTGLAAGFYTVRVTNTSDPNSQNCFSTAEIEVTQTLTDPSGINGSVTDQSYCVNPNGAITADVGGATAGYTFYWFDGDVASPDLNNPDYTGSSISDLLAGDYTLVVEDNITSCTSTPQTFTVADLTTTPTIALASSTELTSCDSPNGSISITADGTTAGYNFRWFNGSSTAAIDEIMPSPGATITGLTAGTYTVLAENSTTGCFDIYEHTVLDNRITPVPTVTVIDQSQCDPLNGEIQANVGGATADYNFYWFDGNIASPNLTSPDRTGATISGLTAGEYTLVVEDDVTKCTSVSQVLTIQDLTPTISGTITLDAAQTSCDTSAPNGALSVVGSGGTSYTYEWFTGADASGTSFTSGASITGLSAQTYTVLITDASGCSEEVSFTVPSAIVYPEVDIDNVVPNSVCDPALTSPAISNNGEIEASIGGVTAGYTFYWFDGDVAAPDISAPDFTGPTYSNLPSGDYTVVVVEDATSCPSNRLVVRVPDATPTLNGSITLNASQTSCDASAPNGELTAAGSGGIGTYSYEWYTGTDTSGAGFATTANVSGLEAQTYTVIITDQGSGCSEEVSFTVPSAIVYPEVDIDNVVPNSVCDPALTSPAISNNGEIEASIGGVTAGYTFYWFDGDVAAPDISAPDFTGPTYSNLPSGDYTVVVVEDATSCPSNRLVVRVPDATPTLNGSITLNASQTSCDASAPNGELTAAGSGGIGTYSYEWYTGTDTSGAGFATTANVSGLEAQTYTVIITDQGSGCSEEVSFTVPSAIVYPEVDIDNVVPNSVCDPALTSPAISNNGEIEASIGGVTAGYTFYWFDGDVAAPDISAPDFTGPTYSNLPSGDYTVVVVEDATSCPSNRLVVRVPDATPTLNGSITLNASQTSCDASAPNGELTAAGSGGIGTYSYEWYTGTDTSGAGFATTANVSGLEAQTYTVIITDQGSGCSEEVSFTVPSAIVYPEVDIDNVVPNSVCDPALTSPAISNNGEIEASIGGVTAGYTFYWFDGDVAAPDISAPDFTGPTYSNLPSGDYTVVVVEDATTCPSDRLVVTVPDATPTIGGAITLDAAQTSCDTSAPNGELTAAGSGGTSYTYDWYPGTDTSDPTDIIVSTANITGLSAQTYTVVITDEATGCQEEVSYALPSDIKKPLISIDPNADITPNSVCNPALATAPAYNGAITANVTYDGAAITLADYRFDWYIGNDTSGAADFSATGAGANNYPNLAAGEYSLVVTRINPGTGFQCSSEPITVTVPNDITTPTASINKDALQTSCGAPNGQLTATGASGSGSYGYEWFVGSDATIAFNDGVDGNIIGANGETIQNIAAGDYTIRVTDLATGCRTTQNIYLDENIIDPVVSLAVTTPMTDCSFDGVITPTITSANAAPSGHSFTWHAGQSIADPVIAVTTDAGTSNPELSTANTGTTIYSGYYTVVVTDIFTGCVSSTETIFLDRPAPLFNIKYNVNVLPSTCGVDEGIVTAYVDANSNGTLDPGEVDYANYTFEWYLGNPTDLAANYYTNPEPVFAPNSVIAIDQNGDYPGSIPGGAGVVGTDYFAPDNATQGASLFGRESGQYTVVVTGPTGCKEFIRIDIGFNNGAEVVVAEVEITNSTNCSTPNGSLEVTDLANIPGGQSFSNYSYEWYEGTNEDIGNEIVNGSGTVITTALLNQNGATMGLSPGYYTVVPIETFPSFCRLTPYTMFLDSAARQPVLGAAITPNTSCIGNGQIAVTATPNAPDTLAATTYSYSWADDGTEVTNTRTGLTPGDYTVTVTDNNTTCSITRTYTILDQRVIPSISNITPVAQTYCNPNGSLTIDATEITPGTPDEYTYQVFLNGTDAADEITGSTTVTATAASVVFSNLEAGTYYINATRTVAGADAEGCTSAFIQETVADDLDPVVLSLTQTENTSCDPVVNSDASIELAMSTPSLNAGISGATYNIIVDNQPGATLTDQLGIASPFEYGVDAPGNGEIVLPGSYTFTIQNNVSGCTVTRSITVEDNPEPIVFSRSDLTVLPQQLCNPDGEISVSSISPGAVGEYTYTWYEGSVDAANIVGGSGSVLNSGTYGSISAGVYYVVASRIAGNNPGSGCSSVAVRVEIPNEQVDPVLSLSQTANTACDPNPNSDATLTVEMETPSPTAGILNSTYTIDFTSVPTDASVASFTTGAGPGPLSVTFPQAAGDLIMPGTYEVMVTNDVSNCSITRSITVGDNPEPIVFSRSDLTVLPQQLCNPDGEISVSSISPGAVGEYTYTWYAGSVDAANIVGGSGSVLNSGTYGSISAGVYYVVASRIAGNNPGSGCSSVPVRVEIPNEQVDPVLSLSQTANTVCDPDPNSDATLTVEMETPSPTAGILNSTYTIDFTSVPTDASVASFTTGAGPGPLSVTFPQDPTDLIMPGTYEVMVTNDVSNCSITRSITVGDNPEPIVFSRSDLTVLPQQLCNPDGEISVSSISPGAVGEYTYTWYAGSVDAANIVGGSGSVLNSATYGSITAGVYYVVASRIAGNNPGSGCSSVAVRVEIPNEQVDPVLSLSQTANTACDPNPNSDATLTVEMETPSPTAGILNSTYTIDFTSVPTDASVASFTTGAGPGPLSVTFPQDPTDLIMPGTYEVMVTNDVSNCSITRSITVEDNPEPIVFSRSDLTVLPQQLCNPDGEISVSSISPGAVGEYTYTWFAGSVDAANIVGGSGSVLNSGTYGSISAGVYYVVASRIAGNNPGSGCSSVPVRVEIPNEQVDPVLSLSQTANTACDPDPNSDATLTVEMETPSPTAGILNSTYTIDFTSLPTDASVASFTTGAGPGPLSVTFPQAAGDLIMPGTYEVMVTNDVSNCSITRSITVGDNPEPIVFSRSDLTVLPQQLCNPDGEISVSSISPGAVGEYTYTWFAGSVDAANIVGGSGSVLNSGTYGSISAGVYYVVASRIAGNNPGSGCSSVAVRVEIPNEQVDPIVSLSQTANTACDPNPNSDATLTVEMETPSPTAGILNSTYTIDFTSVPTDASVVSFTTGAGPGPLSVTFPQDPTDLIMPGTYEVMVTNDVSNCSITRSITVEDNPQSIILRRNDISVTDATNCTPSGSITVNSIDPSAINNYTFRWYNGEANYTSGNEISGEITNTLSNLSPGEYYVEAIRNAGENPGSTCISNIVRVEVLDAAIRPDIVIVENAPNSSCDPANPNGSISASVNGEPLADFTYEWFIGLDNTSSPVPASQISGASGETISGLSAGNYTVRVTDNTAPGQACSSIESFYLLEDLTIDVAKDVTFDITPQSDCFDSGAITVASLSPGLPSDFTYEWYYESFDANGLINGGNTETITAQPAGTYYVMITNSATSCITEQPIEVEIPFTATSPAIELLGAKPNTDCDPNTPDGFLEVSADGGQTAGYTFTWYQGDLPIEATSTEIGNANRINALDSGYYSVEVYSTITNCSSTAQFYVEFSPELPKISLTTAPVTNCGSPNGAAYAQIYNMEGNFQFNWYIGNSIKNQPDFTGDWLTGLPVEDYTVEAIDLDAPACTSEIINFSIEELIEVPQLKLNQISPNTYCDPDKVNGVAEAIIYYVDEEDPADTAFVTSRFEVLWFRSESYPNGGEEYSGRINSELAATEYTISYRNTTTNCIWESNITITEDLTVVPSPEVEITALFDSCEEPNGAAEISASDLNPNYEYRWYFGEVSDSAELLAPDVHELEVGTYYVTATDTVSGCVSEPTLVEIEDGRVAPEISLSIEPELCGEYNGLATITINDEYEYRSIEWDTPYGTAYGESFDEFTAGNYSVTVIGSNGCEYTREFSVPAEINVFNGISPNNDGENDVWEIGCISNFEGNRVQIYNRAGALVFSTEGYDNSSNTFSGFGNRGIYAGEKILPDGTYFYVIDKNDGSEAVTGYLELFR
ncbi:gliding motility-associated C-terminal domain-containing protein [Marivirga arenosa]|uniref:Gliding motility-associated C-terminal domain-containing protein n=1 Tax=Marivirga arenosa TaxID=3059076 RepID=A0AA51RDY7_9BACT|nr:gliding motility-associated C-terminal domain-containing protein [Marivirga sp. ABR2-2]WMN08030.1 gliding motility-associated C-terminal domain-containing protein [Marivirga sp. ABR2-2]